MLKVEMVAVFVAKCADKGPKRGDVFLHCGPHPDPDGHGGGIVVTEKFTGPVLTNAQRTRRQDADGTWRHLIELRQRLEELVTGDANLLSFAGFHSGFDGMCGIQ